MKSLSMIVRKKQTNIVATIGSASESIETLEAMARAGMTVARINMSHSSHDDHHTKIVNIRKVTKKTGISIKILIDLGGPKIRVGEMEKDTILVEGKSVIITTKSCLGNAERFSVSYSKLPKEVAKGLYILISDGKKKLQVLSTNGEDEITCKVIIGGLVTSRRGVNIPGAKLTLPVITAKDKKI